METTAISNPAQYPYYGSAKPDDKQAVAKWRKQLFTLQACRGRLTLSHLSLQGIDCSDSVKLEKPSITKIHFCPCDGASGPVYIPNAKTILLRRSDFLRLHDYALHHGPLRDFCLIRVPMKCGLRPGEIACLRWENVDFHGLTLNVIDSKKKVAFPIPIDLATADYLRELKADHAGGWVIRRNPNHVWHELETHLGYENLEYIVKRWAKKAGCETWQKMRVYDLRHYFAANWVYPSNGKRPGNLHALSKILRHKNLLSTQVYLSRLVFYEDIQAEYNRLQTMPFVQQNGLNAQAPAIGNEFFDMFCRVCNRRSTCRYIDEAMQSGWANGCKYFEKTLQKEEINHSRN